MFCFLTFKTECICENFCSIGFCPSWASIFLLRCKNGRNQYSARGGYETGIYFHLDPSLNIAWFSERRFLNKFEVRAPRLRTAYHNWYHLLYFWVSLICSWRIHSSCTTTSHGLDLKKILTTLLRLLFFRNTLKETNQTCFENSTACVGSESCASLSVNYCWVK